MLTPVSFGSIYRINTNEKSNPNQQFFSQEVGKYCEERRIPYTEISQYESNYPIRQQKFTTKTTIFAPDKKDNDLEIYLAAHGIKFVKHTQEEVFKPSSVISRVERAPEDYRTVIIDSEKLENVLICQEDNNFYSTKSLYKKGDRKEALSMLKSLNKFPASTLHITTWYNPEETREKIKSSGKVQNDSIVFNFEKTTEKPDNLMYFAMKEAGLKDIPVYMDDESYKTAQALGIVKE
jgi:hypothetical protein